MTVSVATCRATAVTDGTLGPFSFGFKILASSELIVYRGTTLLVEDVDYTVSSPPWTAGGTITKTGATPWDSGQTLTMFRSSQPVQSAVFSASDSFPSASMETALDKMVMLVQELDDRIRGIPRTPIEEALGDLSFILPAAAARAGKYLAFDVNGLPTMAEIVESAVTQAIVQQYMSEWIDLAHVPTRESDTEISVPGDQTIYYTANRRLRVIGDTTGYGTISSSSFAASKTTITVVWDSGTTPTTPTGIAFGLMAPANPATLAAAIALLDTAGVYTATNVEAALAEIKQSGSYTGSLTGYATPLTPTVQWRRSGNRVGLWIASDTTGTSNAATMTLTGMPAAIRPTVDKAGILCGRVVDNGDQLIGVANVLNTGVIAFVLPTADDAVADRVSQPATGNFTTSGTKGLNSGWNLAYDL